MENYRQLVALAFLILGFAARAATDEQKKLAFAAVERNAAAIATLSDNVYYFAELGMQEHETSKLLAETLRSIGFRVRTGDAGMPTNVWAEWGSGASGRAACR